MPKRGGLKPAGKRQESATFLQRSFFDVAVQFSLAAAQLLVQMTSALQKSQCCSAVSAAQHSENCSAASVFACGMLQGRGLEGWGLGLAELQPVPRKPCKTRISVQTSMTQIKHKFEFSSLTRIRKVRVSIKFLLSEKHLIRFKFLRHVMRAIWSLRPKCSHRCVSLKETPLKPVKILKHRTKNSTEQTVMRTKWFKHIAI